MGGGWRLGGEEGQGTVEWIGLVLLVAVAVVALLVAGPRVPGGALARAIAGKIVCAVRLSDACGDAPALERAYGAEVAALAADHAPRIRYERGMTALPVDFRRCRRDACSRGTPTGQVWRSTTGEPVVAFVHVIDCRATAIARTRRAGADCSGPRRGNLYLQYWFYYAGSATAEGRVIPGAIRDVSKALGTPTHHRDDWESYQVRIRPGAADARASAHHGYVYDLDGGWRPHVGARADGSPRVRAPWPKQGWGPETRTLYVSGGSHAGNARALRRVERITPRDRLALIPFEAIGRRAPAAALRGHAAVAQGRLARPRGRWDGLDSQRRYDHEGKQTGRWQCVLAHDELPRLFSCERSGESGDVRQWPHALVVKGVGEPS